MLSLINLQEIFKSSVDMVVLKQKVHFKRYMNYNWRVRLWIKMFFQWKPILVNNNVYIENSYVHVKLAELAQPFSFIHCMTSLQGFVTPGIMRPHRPSFIDQESLDDN